ncbi:MAG: GTPase [Candidatus Infernicultor aquiphilus]|uniref:GTPase n=2 Tax=Candidatus Infernicultor aquiphilus TaxID=1805029 RepID=A0A1J5GNP4_9BACT|nr:GTPase [bacterium]OIP71178.1 MAG: GTPase [Candidatus Atribacteria bacterium CG2_30_33_13]PIW11886.1 MAG: GTPase [Candidatus Atribacteria bacterium CG17_big_fil_post_rev_8_21_14_2_50_34_11]PIX35029.1 MAG: GTPase [Candidatus Atribacteria bacterium CG_4_8_14_3_um_filter_34_18]PIY32146.1 MAG: GTPase [Candidatus Atribacteria bacterium CG_4_10_14_3_um_filter_34_13]
MGAAGRDFHNFNVYFRNNSNYEVVAFTATQIPDIAGRKYPPELSGPLYPEGIPIYLEEDLSDLIKKNEIDQVILAYSDLPHQYVMDKASIVLSSGADFRLMGPKNTMLKAKIPVVSICAVRTGCGKSQTTRKVSEILKRNGYKIAVIRHPMPYGDLREQIWQRYETYADLDCYNCTIEEREEYEPHIDRGNILYAGVDYQEILTRAEKEADLILWDGGNNDLPFYQPDLHIVVTDPHRAGHEMTYYPGEANLRMADVVVINKIDTAELDKINLLRENIHLLAPEAILIEAASPLTVDHSEFIRGKRVLVVEDGPTLTHGGMKYGAGIMAAQKFGAKEIIDPRPYAVGSIAETYVKYPDIGILLPAMGYGKKQVQELEETINAADCDLVIIGTPIDLTRIIQINKKSIRVKYELQEIGRPNLEEVLNQKFKDRR